MTVAARIKDLSPDDVQRVAILLDEALDLAPQECAAWQAALDEREPFLAAAVAQLLEVMKNDAAATDDRVETVDLLARSLDRAARDQPALAGRRLGPYRVLRLLGQGGMGSVWLAERADGLFERQVALKLVHPSLLMGAALAERFSRERSILATLAHPHIARLLDAGVADDGQPYLALEHVEGEMLTAYCDSRRLTLAQRLRLMLQVLSAVHYAHQNLVIHRDIKPANILVTPRGQVRLLDFGIAKLMSDGQQALETELTQMAGRAITPEYASPEQVAGRAVSTSSDVYSLGVVLYGLLCGQRPYSLPRDSRAALEEAILSSPPVRPSQRLIGDEAARARDTTPRRLAQALEGDLDTIVLKALKKDPAERYGTADALAQDIQRYLDGQPVLARPDSAAYRLRKFVGRNRLKVAVGAAVGVLVLVAAGVSLWQATVAREQAVVAQRESLRAHAVQGFLLDIFRANSVQQADPLRARQTTARELLDVGARRAMDSLKNTPEAQDEVLDTLADMYFQLGLGEDAARMRLYRVQAVRQAYGPRDVRVANALIEYANDISTTVHRERSEAALDEAGRLLDEIGDHASDTRGRFYVESVRLQQYTALKKMRENADAAVRHYREHPGTTHWMGLVQALQLGGRARHLSGDLEGAEATLKEALAEVERHNPGGPVSATITPLVFLAEVQLPLQKVEESEANMRRALAISRKLNGDLSGVTLQTQAKLGGYLHAMGRRAEGRLVMQQTLEALDRKDANATPDAVGTLHRFRGAALAVDGDLAQGEKHLGAELADLRATYAGTLPLARLLLLHAQTLIAMGRYDAAQAELDESWRIWQPAGEGAWATGMVNPYLMAQARLRLATGDTQGALERLDRLEQAPHSARLRLRVDEVNAHVVRAQAFLQQGQAGSARDEARTALAQVEASPLRDRFQTLEADAQLQLGRALQRGRALDEARTHLERAVALRQASDAALSPWLAEAQVALADCLIDLGDRKAARALAQQARSIQARQAALGEHLKAPLRSVEARLQRG
jgi:serine/threonine-protein kinase